MNNCRFLKSFICLLCAGIVLNIFPPQLCEVVRADNTINFENENPTSTCSFRSVEDYSFTADIQTTARWSGHANLEITFTNTGNETIHDWYFTFDFNYNIENPYNCYILEHKNDLYTIGNNDWNQDIRPGQSVTVGFTAASSDGSDITEMPSFYLLNTKTISVSSSDLSFSFQEYSNWTTGFSGALIITNNSSKRIRDWTITFNSNRPITKTDAALLSANSYGTYTVTNDGNNQNINAGQSYRIELQGGANVPSVLLELTNFCVYSRTFALSLNDDKDNNGIADVLETDFNDDIIVTPTITITPTSVPTGIPSNTPTATPTVVVTSVPTISPTVTATPVVTDTPVPTSIVTSVPTATPTTTATPTDTVTPTITDTPTPVITVTPTDTITPTPTAVPTDFPDDIDYETDSDEDELPDDIEDYYGTDKFDKDTDDDGVNDLYEIILETDPLTPDDNGNKDADMDGLTNARESALGTNPQVKDTDIDGLNDGEEYNLYGTDPTKYDTDDDGISDYNEIHLGSNPSLPDSNVKRYQTLEYEPSGSSGLTGVTKVTVSGYISGAICENTKIKDIYNKDLLTSSITALVGDPVNIESTGEFDSMTITFKYTDNLNERYLRVMWFDENNLDYVVLNDYTINQSSNTISINTTHFSKYMLIDESIWVNTWGDNMAMTRNTSALGSSYSLSGYKSKMGRLDDRDSDGLPDIFETNGMLIQTGNVIYTDPSDPDTDKDGLLDGEEMGLLSLTSVIFDRTYFYDYIYEWYAGYGYREFEFAYFNMKSNPTMFSSDPDSASDKDDATINDENEPINYILYDAADDPDLYEVKIAYYNYFNAAGMACQLVPILTQRQFSYFFEYLEYGFDTIAYDGYNGQDDPDYKVDCPGGFNHLPGKRYSCVNELIMVFHGGIGFIDLEHIDDEKFDTVEAANLSNPSSEASLLNWSGIPIKHIDCQFCFASRYTDSCKCMAIELLKITHADAVYACKGELIYVAGYNSVFGFKSDDLYYWYSLGDDNKVYRSQGVKAFDLMFRFESRSAPYIAITDYPE